MSVVYSFFLFHHLDPDVVGLRSSHVSSLFRGRSSLAPGVGGQTSFRRLHYATRVQARVRQGQGGIVPDRAIIAAFHVLVELGKPRRDRFRLCFAFAIAAKLFHIRRNIKDALGQPNLPLSQVLT